MARAEVVHSADAVKVIFRGDKRRPEPTLAVIEFPGGHVEVSRCSDQETYWAHVEVVGAANVVDSRIDYEHGVEGPQVVDMPNGDKVRHIAVRVSNDVPRPDLD